MVFWDILRWLLGEKKKAEEAARYMSPEEAKRFLWRSVYDKLKDRLKLEADIALQEIEEVLREERDEEAKKRVRKMIEALHFELKKKDPRGTIIVLALRDAVKHGLHRDPDRLAKYLMKQVHEAATAYIAQIPWYEGVIGSENLGNVPTIWGKLGKVFWEAGMDEYRKLADKVGVASEEVATLQEWASATEAARKKLDLWVKQNLGLDWWHKTPEEILGIKKEEEEEARPPILRKVLAERLPGWAIKAALDQEKAPLYTDHRGVHPSYLTYHLIRSNPHDPRGTALHAIITKILAQWEREIAAGKKPTHPYDILNHITRTATGATAIDLHHRYKKLTHHEAAHLAAQLGIPQTLTPQALQQAIAELARDLHHLKNGGDPHLLDAEKEAALRHLQLTLLAENAPPDPQALHQALQNIHRVLEHYKKIKAEALTEIQLGREETEKALNALEARLPHLLAELREKLAHQPISTAVAEITRKLAEELKEEIPDPQLKAWTVNLARNFLLDAPILAAATDPATTWKTLDEKKRVAAALAQLYQHEARRHTVAPITPDLHRFHEWVAEAPDREEALERIARIRSIVDGVRSLSLHMHHQYTGLLAEPLHNQHGLHSHEVLDKIAEIKLRAMENTSTALRRARERK